MIPRFKVGVCEDNRVSISFLKPEFVPRSWESDYRPPDSHYLDPIFLKVVRDLPVEFNIRDEKLPAICYKYLELPEGVCPGMTTLGRAMFASFLVYDKDRVTAMDLVRYLTTRMCNFSNKHICRYYAVGWGDCNELPMKTRVQWLPTGYIYVLMEPWKFNSDQPVMTLHELSRTIQLETNEIICYTLQLLDALDYLHNLGSINAFLNSKSIIVKPDRTSIKVMDWCNLLRFSERWPSSSHQSVGIIVLEMLTTGYFVEKYSHSSIIRDGWKKAKLLFPAIPEILVIFCEKCFESNLTARELADFLVQAQPRLHGTGWLLPCFTDSSSFRDPNVRELSFVWHRMIGRGRFGTTFSVVTNNSTVNIKEIFALKTLQSASIAEDRRTKLLNLSNSYILQYKAIGQLQSAPSEMFLPSPQVTILMEYCAGGTLNALCTLRQLSEKEILDYLRQITAALRYLHQHKIIHGDIRGENVLLTSDEATCKVGALENFQTLVVDKNVNVDILKHISPEMLEYLFGPDDEDEIKLARIGPASDVWSIGCTALEMASGGNVTVRSADGTPVEVESRKPKTFLKQVMNGAFPDQTRLAEANFSEQLRLLIGSCLLIKPTERPSTTSLHASVTVVQQKSGV